MLEDISAVSPRWSFTLLGPGAAEQVQGQWVSASLFGLLRVNPILGRTFTAAEDSPGNIQGVILSYDLWQRAYGGSTSVIGTQIRIDNSSAPIIGVMPRGFRFLRDVDLWVPLAPNFVNQRGRATRYLTVAGKLAPGVTIEQARAEMSALMNGFAAKYPNTNTGFSSRLTLLRDFLTTDTRPILLMLAGAVAFVLGQGLRVVLIGLAAGVVIAVAIGPVFARLVYGVGTRDPIAPLTGAGVLLAVALMASYFPARKAAKLDPVAALRT